MWKTKILFSFLTKMTASMLDLTKVHRVSVPSGIGFQHAGQNTEKSPQGHQVIVQTLQLLAIDS